MLDVLLISRNKDATWDISDVQLKKGDTFHGLYHHIGCNVVDIRCVNIKGIDFDIWFDDEFMLREEAPHSDNAAPKWRCFMRQSLDCKK